MPIDRESGKTKHVITEHNNWVELGNGRGTLAAFTFCGWLANGEIETAYTYGGWYLNPDMPNVCEVCKHVLTCEVSFGGGCPDCKIGPWPYPGPESTEETN